MKFDQLISKTYYLLEQDDNAGDQPAPDESGLKDAAQQIDKAGEESQSQLQSTFSELVKLVRELTDIFDQEMSVNKKAFPPRIEELIEQLKNATASPNAIQSLDNIGDVVKSATSEYKPQ
jgi:hypothetical protein